MFRDVFWVDGMKLRRSVVWPVIVLVPIFLSVVGVNNYAEHRDVFRGENLLGWMGAWTQVVFLYGTVLCPVLVGVYAGLINRMEHMGGGWKLMLAYPITRTHVYLSKVLWVWLLIGFTTVMMFVSFWVIGWLYDVEGSFPLKTLSWMFVKGWLASLPLSALFTWVSIQWKNFGMPIALNIVFVLPNVFIINSSMGRIYPWSQPGYAMTPSDRLEYVPTDEHFFWVVIISTALFLAGGIWHFHRTELKG
ncbi:hypothetical protein GCM10007416_32680 [Kroppenstedtia guangzhouensis]|jgi:lantibiotic transport system permease protein|uniref:ABC-2 type transport system permease protein n=1 Tax=Kroppenstedtia guangzhouensis TaxID=1274356 RepID=A0ABQ1H2V3_9BACL|nr:ABC transporter permease [Kroppenstedtia guangzhouensis]GGA56924.1 hypothetical protein GCM10007416_32680 [Kroppenstedtia guangzhouensis]